MPGGGSEGGSGDEGFTGNFTKQTTRRTIYRVGLEDRPTPPVATFTLDVRYTYSGYAIDDVIQSVSISGSECPAHRVTRHDARARVQSYSPFRDTVSSVLHSWRWTNYVYYPGYTTSSSSVSNSLSTGSLIGDRL